MPGNLIPTKASLLKGVQKVEEVTYVSYKPKKKEEKAQANEQAESININCFNIKKAKNEVIKFALSNLEGQEKRNATMQLAIKLGAKPPRRRFKNYKTLMEEKKKEKENEETEAHLQKIGKNPIGESIAKTNKIKKQNLRNKKFKKSVGILEIYGKVKKVTEN